ncbi:hypothetical protein [Desulfopila aestuarii]|uniref:Ubiquitin-protein ligase n=1 Tax=Desulfopila aestuarii DSM 18488 TaxID=1121416 RepID=A0A1M7Y2S2_9BACT|nr:hypothetical protein [Desulfopila aestuarii]SHO46211.1 hypothetical protein SAMN02745220_01363 [Desulfopila aestuarii DSM 18488]
MSLDSQELRRIFSEIQAEFFNKRDIEIHPVSGDPPSQYEVIYHIPCTIQDEQGNVIMGSSHTVLISIPFGFPHFPPSCKPKTAVFHPDFDSAAISLADFWNRDRTLPELINHIGDMLSGRIYSTDNAFNEDAALWFRQNTNQLPFRKEAPSTQQAPPERPDDTSESEPLLEFDDTFDFDDAEEQQQPSDFNDIPESPGEPTINLTIEPEEESPAEISTMEEHDFMDDFQFSHDIPEAPVSSAALPGLSGGRIDTDKLKHLANRRNFCQLDTELTAIPTDNDFPERQDLFEKTATALARAQKLYTEAEEYENQGLADKALECFKAVENLVADYPNIRADISRAENATEMLQDIHEPTNGRKKGRKNGQSPDKSTPAKRKKSKNTLETTEELLEEEKKTVPKKIRRPVNILPYIVVGGLLAVLAPLTYFYFTLNSRLTEARQLFSECTTSFAAKDFQAAEKACAASMSTSKNIYLIHQTAITELQTGIRGILDSEEMQQGLLGKVLYNEKYVPKSTLSAHQSLQEFLDQGKGFLETSAWDQAAASFQKALELSRQIEDFSPDERMSIEQNLNYAAFRSMLNVAETQVDGEEWQTATATLTELQGQISKLSPRQQAEYREYVDTLLAKSRFTSLKEQADSLFSRSDWAGAVTLFQKAVEAGRTLSEKENSELAGIKANISRAELYSTINAGNSAFSGGRWDEAIEKYTEAIGILNANTKILDPAEIEQSRKKLDRIILQSAIIRDRQTADRNKANGKTAETQTYLLKVIKTIQSSAFANDPEFQEIITETKKAQDELKETIFVEERQTYLVDNYIRLFMENYPAAAPETLSNPSASFVKRLGRLYLFKLQCTESGRGRPLNLIMFYTYDPDSKRWHFHNLES